MTQAYVFIIDSLCGGGAQRVVVTLANEFARRKLNVHVVVTEDENVFELDKHIKYYVLNKRIKKTKIKFLYRKKLSDNLRRYINLLEKKHKVIIYTNLERSHFICHLADINAFYVIHSSLSQNIAMRKKDFYSKLMSKRKFESMYEGKKIICVSNGVKNDLVDNFFFYPSSLNVIYNPFEIDKIKKMSEKKIDLPINEPFVLSVATLKDQKRIDITVESFAKANLNAKLLFLGINNDSDKLKIYGIADLYDIKDKIVFVNWTDNPSDYKKSRFGTIDFGFRSIWKYYR
jgi:glycosyltransferase involved in cell wall biosynthesis